MQNRYDGRKLKSRVALPATNETTNDKRLWDFLIKYRKQFSGYPS